MNRSAQRPADNAVKKATGKRYQWPPPPEPYVPTRKHPVQSIVTALPVIMLLAGLFLFYRHESAEVDGAPLVERTQQIDGRFEGLSSVASGGEGRHYLWVLTDERRRGPRVTAAQARRLATLEKGDRLQVFMAPHVAGSKTLWAWKVVHQGKALIDLPAP